MKRLAIVVLSSSLILVACREEAAPPAKSTNTVKASAPAPVLPDGLFTAPAPADAKSLSEVRAASKSGDVVTFNAYVGGREKPFTEGRALFLVADSEKAPACDHDSCKTQWDACCVPQEDIAANSASVQVTDAQGQVIKLGIEGTVGLVAGSLVTISGKVREQSEAVMIVDATSIAIRK